MNLAPLLTMRRERKIQRENRERGMDVRLTMHSSFLSSSPSATQQKEREGEGEKRWISLLLTTMQLLLQHAQDASAHLCLQDSSSFPFYLVTPSPLSGEVVLHGLKSSPHSALSSLGPLDSRFHSQWFFD